jgi:UrcA family protein
MEKLVTLVAAALATLSFTAPASAADAPAPSRTVEVGNLSTPAGVEAFNRRVRHAAEAVCGDAPGVRPLAETRWISRCVDAAIASGRPTQQAAASTAPTV